MAQRYLLGALSDDERDQLEQRYFSDTAEFDEIEIAEDDLVDAYIRGQLTADDSRRFEIVASSSPRLRERVEFAKLLSQKTEASPVAAVEEVPKRRSWWQLFAFDQPGRLASAFGVLLVLLGGLLVFGAWLQVRQRSEAMAAREAALEQRRQEIERLVAQSKANNEQWASDVQTKEAQLREREQAVQEIEPARPPSDIVARLFLQPGATRAEGRNSETTLTRNTTRIRFNLDVTDSDSQRYRATVVTPDQKAISRPQILTPRKNRSGDFIILEVPAKGLSAGDFLVKVEGLSASGEIESTNDYPFRLKQSR